MLNQQDNNDHTALQSKIIKFLESHAYPSLFEACKRDRQSISIAITVANSLRQLQQPTIEEIKSCVSCFVHSFPENAAGTFAGVLEKIDMMCEEAQRDEVASMSPGNRMG